jgi:hypothetical protein
LFFLIITGYFRKFDLHETSPHSTLICALDCSSQRHLAAHYHFDKSTEGSLLAHALGDSAVWQVERLIIMMKPLHLIGLCKKETDDPTDIIDRNA